MKKLIKEATKKYYEQFSLSENQLNSLESRVKNTKKEINYARGQKLATLAASIVGVFFLGFLVYQNNTLTIKEQLIEEIAYNHKKNLNPEIISSSFKQVRQYFSKLDFVPVNSKTLPTAEWELIGGRYCSLQNELAVQLRLRDKKSDNVYTWYQLSNKNNLIHISETYDVFKDGMRVQIWEENGIIHGLAGGM